MKSTASSTSFSSTVASTVLAIMDPLMAKLTQARQMLAEVASVKEVKNIHAVAAAAEMYARRQQLGEEAISFAYAVKIEALRRLGEILKNQKETIGLAQGRRSDLVPRENQVKQTLDEIGIDKKTSSIAQRLADLPQEVFEEVKTRTISIAFAFEQMNRDRRKSESPHISPESDFHNDRDVIGIQDGDPIAEPVKMCWERVMVDLRERGWSTSRIAGAMVLTASTVQRWHTCDDITFGYGYALLILHKHVCGQELTKQRIVEASLK